MIFLSLLSIGIKKYGAKNTKNEAIKMITINDRLDLSYIISLCPIPLVKCMNLSVNKLQIRLLNGEYVIFLQQNFLSFSQIEIF